ncbi:MAG: insulinase family protein [Phycisphaerae bacterium]|jgi:predicted Zn-dependent peptidase|nr:insulinase family protein [Phycisphaerae bacterium]
MPATASPSETAQVYHLRCGMPLIIERSDTAQSAALCWLLPVGNASDPEGRAGDGHAVILSELILRGAGPLDSRGLSDALDRLGVQRATSPGAAHLQMSATMLGKRVLDALPFLVSVVRAPLLPEQHLDPVRSLCLQQLEGLDDDPQQLVMLRLRERHLPPPFNRTGYGNQEALESTSIKDLRNAWASRARPGGSILAVAGNVDGDAIASLLDRELEGWTGSTPDPKELRPPMGGVGHEESESSQTHIAMGFKAPPEGDPQATPFRIATRILGGDTSCRLFNEVREKRGLCYSVGANYAGGRDRGMLSIYAGSTHERAQDTIDCIAREVERFEGGVEADEFHRAIVGYKSRLVMSGESTAARAASAAGDFYRLGRVRSLAELAAEVDRISLESLNRSIGELFHESWRGTRSAFTIGPKPMRFA